MKLTLDFQANANKALWASFTLCVISLALFIVLGFKASIDFNGGVIITIDYKPDIKISQGNISHYMNHTAITSKVESKQAIIGELKEMDIKPLKIEHVGPKMGSILKRYAIIAAVFVVLGLAVCSWLQFGNSFAIASVVAILHDILITMGAISLLRLEFGLPVLAAILTMAGYSINDTVVVFNRLRQFDYPKAYNMAIVSIIPRTLITSFTTIMSLLFLSFIPESSVSNFAICMVIGIFIGTYSSIFIATPIAMGLYKPTTSL